MRGSPNTYTVALILSAFSALWLLVAIFFLGDISAHFNPAMTFAFALRKDMNWAMAIAYWCRPVRRRNRSRPAGPVDIRPTGQPCRYPPT